MNKLLITIALCAMIFSGCAKIETCNDAFNFFQNKHRKNKLDTYLFIVKNECLKGKNKFFVENILGNPDMINNEGSFIYYIKSNGFGVDYSKTFRIDFDTLDEVSENVFF